MVWPTDPVFEAVNFRSREYNVMSESITGRTQSRGLGGQRWEFTAKYSNMSEAEFLPIRAEVMKQRGSRGSFNIRIPELSWASELNTMVGTCLTNGAHSTGTGSIAVDGFTGTMKAGEFIKFSGFYKVYMITEDLTDPGNMTIRPHLVDDIPDGTTVTRNDFPFRVRLKNDVQEFKVGLAGIYNYELDFIEDLG